MSLLLAFESPPAATPSVFSQLLGPSRAAIVVVAAQFAVAGVPLVAPPTVQPVYPTTTALRPTTVAQQQAVAFAPFLYFPVQPVFPSVVTARAQIPQQQHVAFVLPVAAPAAPPLVSVVFPTATRSLVSSIYQEQAMAPFVPFVPPPPVEASKPTQIVLIWVNSNSPFGAVVIEDEEEETEGIMVTEVDE